ncbi:porin [Paenalcaligenes sp. Me131]|uniref:porin n=1 Tax=Paenalcaligenes sp. Me131 TaxID=3392636 RepID=UPI003D27CEFC
MKKTLLAAALMAGFAGVAQAETSVTLYGIVDTGLGYTQFKDKDSDAKATRTGFYDGVQSGNRWGLRGSEDLGDGLRAVFTLESGFKLTDGQSLQGDRLFGREATLGLAGDSWGSLVFGRQQNVASRYIADIASPFGDSMELAAIGKTFTSAATVRADNTVVYATPNFNGFDFAIGYSFNVDGQQEWNIKNTGQANPKDDNQKLVTTGLRYANGPVAVAVSYDNLKASNWDKSVQAWNLAGSYDFEVVKLHLAWGQERNGTLSTRGVKFNDDFDARFGGGGNDMKDYKVNNFAVGVSAPVGAAGKVMAGWAMSRASSNDWYNDTYEGQKKSQNLFSLGYTYNLSKRTNVYAVGTYGTGYMFQDVRATQAIVGLRHRF